MMSQRQIIIQKLTDCGRITNADFVKEFKHFTGRNRVTDSWMKGYWSERGFEISHFFGKTWLENGWELKPILGAGDQAAGAVVDSALSTGVMTRGGEHNGWDFHTAVHPPAPTIFMEQGVQLRFKAVR